ncbi:MAG: glycosyltransferase family 4 protein [Candidatus Pacebacteria bacterium]|nr:glycosyltransferase family 4 protein [Candidatus Paceibacterota bacterium]
MKIGLIIKKEEYWSLKKITNDILDVLSRNFNLMILCLKNNKIENQNDLDELYKQCDIVLYLASKLINFRRKYNKPTVFYMHAWMDHGAGINIYINRNIFKYNDVLAFTSSSSRNKFNQVYDTNLKTTIFPYFTKNRIISLNKKEEKCLRDKYGILEKAKILIYFGRFSPEKNIELLFDIANKLKNSNFVILIIGNFVGNSTFGFGDMEEEKYKEMIEKRFFSDMSNKIILLKNVNGEDLCNLMMISYLNINLTTCFEEDFSLSTIESFSAGLPVIASNWGGIKDIVRNNKEGFLIETYFKDNKVSLDIDGVVNFLNEILTDIDIRKKLSENSLLRFKEFYSEKAFLKNIDSLIFSINNDEREVRDVFIGAKKEYELLYISALKKNNVGAIYLNNPWLFRSLYKNYLGNIHEN